MAECRHCKAADVPAGETEHPQCSAHAEKYIRAAQEIWQDFGGVEIDDNATISEGDPDGAYVQAWVWVYKTDAGLPQADEVKD